MTAPARRVLVRSLIERGLSERRALAVIGMSPSALRYTPAADRNGGNLRRQENASTVAVHVRRSFAVRRCPLIVPR